MDQRRALLPTIQASGDISTCVQNIPTTSFVIDLSAFILGSLVWASGLIPLDGLYLGLFSFFRSDKPLRPISPCQPIQEMARPAFSYLWNPHPTFPVELTIFTDASAQGWGAQMRDTQISGFGPIQTASSTTTLWSSRR